MLHNFGQNATRGKEVDKKGTAKKIFGIGPFQIVASQFGPIYRVGSGIL